jgi:hypothetical protein
MFYLGKNSYELNDNYSGLPLGPASAVQEDEYYAVAKTESFTHRFRETCSKTDKDGGSNYP